MGSEKGVMAANREGHGYHVDSSAVIEQLIFVFRFVICSPTISISLIVVEDRCFTVVKPVTSSISFNFLLIV